MAAIEVARQREATRRFRMTTKRMKTGKMGEFAEYAAVEAWDSYWGFGDDETWKEPGPITFHKCRYCGKEPLFWRKFLGKWRLAYLDTLQPNQSLTTYRIHFCPEKPLQTKTCSICGTKHLFWAERNGKWRLVDEFEQFHRCNGE